VRHRLADASDAAKVAELHAESWRRHYRGAYSDSYLDGDVTADRLAHWTERLCRPDSSRVTLIAEDAGRLVGFGHVILDKDPVWGALLDNLHVAHGLKRRGIGTRLLDEAARAVIGAGPSSGLYLWVLEQNDAAQAFYQARGGRRSGRELVPAPGGDPTRLNGAPWGFRYAWSDPSVLLVRG
jgi:ribosomal protein S18 acetylase RimI-like enzyme